jgi:hypothetical protein
VISATPKTAIHFMLAFPHVSVVAEARAQKTMTLAGDDLASGQFLQCRVVTL